MANKVRPKKALGQHFLTSKEIADRIAATLDDYKGLPVIEVGPGMGVLTRPLLDAGHDVYAVEVDGESLSYLRDNFTDLPADRLIDADFLKLDLAKVVTDGQMCVIGNYPYNISSQIFFHILEYKDRVVCCSGMLQREVAERIAAKEGSRTRGILSVLLQAWYDIEYLFTVSETVFNPPPKVKSGVIRMRRNGVSELGCDERLFKTVVKTSFGQRRKTLRNSLRSLLPPEVKFPEEGPTAELLKLRPEQLSVERFIELTNIISEYQKQSS